MRIESLAGQIKAQADRLFPNRTDSSMFLKIYSETGELVSAETQDERAGELADLLIMLLDYGARHKIDMTNAIVRKMGTNESRKWATNELGVNQHVE